MNDRFSAVQKSLKKKKKQNRQWEDKGERKRDRDGEKNRRVRTVLMQVSFSQRVVNAWKWSPKKGSGSIKSR